MAKWSSSHEFVDASFSALRYCTWKYLFKYIDKESSLHDWSRSSHISCELFLKIQKIHINQLGISSLAFISLKIYEEKSICEQWLADLHRYANNTRISIYSYSQGLWSRLLSRFSESIVIKVGTVQCVKLERMPNSRENWCIVISYIPRPQVRMDAK